MAIIRAFSSFLLWAIVWSCVSLDAAHGLPQFIVSSGKAKCVSVEVPRETMVKIHYEAPDIDTDSNSGKYAPSYITLIEKPIETLQEQRLEQATDAKSMKQRRTQLNDLTKRLHPKPVSQEIKEFAGSFLHRIHAEDAVVKVCIRASKATQQNPMLFHIRVEELDEDVLDEFEQQKADQNGVPLLGAEHHWSFMETQLDRIEHEMHTIIKEADFSRERDALYHQQTDDLHKATLFWPILHCCILVLTGITQANHIISFFKQRRII